MLMSSSLNILARNLYLDIWSIDRSNLFLKSLLLSLTLWAVEILSGLVGYLLVVATDCEIDLLSGRATS